MAIPTKIAKYLIQRPISQGGMGAVYLGFDPELQRLVAIKVLRDDVDGDEPRARFAREARAAAGLRHPHIVTIHDFGVHDGHPYLVMEFIPGETLAEIISRRTTMPLARRVQMIEELCGAVAYAHKMHLVHRDIKPGNVMLDPEGVIKVLDFGIARTPESALTKQGVVMGTLNYMSPEQFAGGPVDHRSDIFAVGAVLYELMTFERAFEGDVGAGVILKILQEDPPPLRLFHSDLDSELSDVVHRALDKDPSKRYQDLSVMRRDLACIRARIDQESAQPLERLGAAAEIRRELSATQRYRSRQTVLLEPAFEANTAREFERAIAAGQEANRLAPSMVQTEKILIDARHVVGASKNTPSAPKGSRTFRDRRHAVLAVFVGSISLWLFLLQSSDGHQPPTIPSAVTALPSKGTAGLAPTAPAVSPSMRAVSIPRLSAAELDRLLLVVRSQSPVQAIDGIAAALASYPGDAALTRLLNQTPKAARDEPPSLPPSPPPAEPPKLDSPLRSEPKELPLVSDGPERASHEPPGGSLSLGIARATDSRSELPSGQTDAQLIEQTLQKYAAAVSARDAEALSQVVMMDAAARVHQQVELDKYDSLSMKLRVVQGPEIVGSKATVRCSTEERVGMLGRSRRDRTSKVHITLQKTEGHWMVRDVRELR